MFSPLHGDIFVGRRPTGRAPAPASLMQSLNATFVLPSADSGAVTRTRTHTHKHKRKHKRKPKPKHKKKHKNTNRHTHTHTPVCTDIYRPCTVLGSRLPITNVNSDRQRTTRKLQQDQKNTVNSNERSKANEPETLNVPKLPPIL